MRSRLASSPHPMKIPLDTNYLNHALAQTVNPSSRISMAGVQWAMDLFGIKSSSYDKGDRVGWHRHEEGHFEIVLSGRIHFWSQQGELELNPFQVLFIPPGVEHRWKCLQPGVMIGLIIVIEGLRRDELVGFLRQAIPTGLLCVKTPEIRNVLNEILIDGLTDKLFNRYLLGQHLFILACKTLREIPAMGNWEAAAVKRQGLHSPKEEIVEKVKAYINEHLAEPLSLEAIARHVNIGVRHLNRVFYEIERNSPHRYLSKKRLNHARGLILKNPHASIKFVAHEAGFTTNTSYFSRQFKRLYQSLPSTFRERILAKR